jgi:hypothetical protein
MTVNSNTPPLPHGKEYRFCVCSMTCGTKYGDIHDGSGTESEVVIVVAETTRKLHCVVAMNTVKAAGDV